MAVRAKIKIKLSGEDAKQMAQDPRIAAAFHEVHAKTPKTVKATGKTGAAKQKMLTAIALSKARAAGAKVPDKSGSNYVSRNDLAVPPGATQTVSRTKGSERVPYKKVELAGSDPAGAHADRKKLNDVRESRTKLGRGKPAIIEVE